MNSFEATLNISRAHLKCAIGHVELSVKLLEAWREKNPCPSPTYEELHQQLENIQAELNHLVPRKEPRW